MRQHVPWLFSWVRYVEEDVDHNGGKENYFTDVTVEKKGKNAFTIKNTRMDKKQGIYRTSLQSEMGCNLLVDINLERPANKLPVTINTIGRLKSEVASLNTDLENVKSKKCS